MVTRNGVEIVIRIFGGRLVLTVVGNPFPARRHAGESARDLDQGSQYRLVDPPSLRIRIAVPILHRFEVVRTDNRNVGPAGREHHVFQVDRIFFALPFRVYDHGARNGDPLRESAVSAFVKKDRLFFPRFPVDLFPFAFDSFRAFGFDFRQTTRIIDGRRPYVVPDRGGSVRPQVVGVPILRVPVVIEPCARCAPKVLVALFGALRIVVDAAFEFRPQPFPVFQILAFGQVGTPQVILRIRIARLMSLVRSGPIVKQVIGVPDLVDIGFAHTPTVRFVIPLAGLARRNKDSPVVDRHPVSGHRVLPERNARHQRPYE